jgi:hypothetical protein
MDPLAPLDMRLTVFDEMVSSWTHTPLDPHTGKLSRLLLTPHPPLLSSGLTRRIALAVSRLTHRRRRVAVDRWSV